MRIERKARMTTAETNREEENTVSRPAARVGSEPNQFSLEQHSPDHVSADQASADQASPDQASGDQATIDQARASWLAAQTGPAEIRSERLAAIQTAMANGTYQTTPEQTAEAILSEQQIRNGTAA
jgi:anti-sigma28 factor (negative regulator of flagellin synthesis)